MRRLPITLTAAVLLSCSCLFASHVLAQSGGLGTTDRNKPRTANPNPTAVCTLSKCGQYLGDCGCDAACLTYNDCCLDYSTACPKSEYRPGYRPPGPANASPVRF